MNVHHSHKKAMIISLSHKNGAEEMKRSFSLSSQEAEADRLSVNWRPVWST